MSAVARGALCVAAGWIPVGRARMPPVLGTRPQAQSPSRPVPAGALALAHNTRVEHLKSLSRVHDSWSLGDDAAERTQNSGCTTSDRSAVCFT